MRTCTCYSRKMFPSLRRESNPQPSNLRWHAITRTTRTQMIERRPRCILVRTVHATYVLLIQQSRYVCIYLFFKQIYMKWLSAWWVISYINTRGLISIGTKVLFHSLVTTLIIYFYLGTVSGIYIPFHITCINLVICTVYIITNKLN